MALFLCFVCVVTVNGNTYAGGFVGSNQGTIQNCYSTGSVNSGNSVSDGYVTGGIGGFLGKVSSNGTVKSVFTTQVYNTNSKNIHCIGETANGERIVVSNYILENGYTASGNDAENFPVSWCEGSNWTDTTIWTMPSSGAQLPTLKVFEQQ